jgi:hypothetical protein
MPTEGSPRNKINVHLTAIGAITECGLARTGSLIAGDHFKAASSSSAALSSAVSNPSLNPR